MTKPSAHVGIRVEGLASVMNALRRAGVDVMDLRDAMSDIAQLGARRAIGYAPKQSGTLAGSIRGNRGRTRAHIIAGRARIPYAGWINYGLPTRNIEPSLFMQRASADVEPYALRRLQANIDAAIRRAGF